jgi:hypothetical protein
MDGACGMMEGEERCTKDYIGKTATNGYEAP